jgi:hypothetical protein
VKLHKDLREFVELLTSLKVEFLVVGGHAVAFHGHPRFTGDIDFLVARTPANAARLVACLDRFGFASAGISEDDLLQPDHVFQLGRPPNRIDLLTGISGVAFDVAWARRVAGDLDGLPVSYLSLEDLLRNKVAAGRAKDLADVATLEQIERLRGPE